jgi:hypothetical protein
MSAARALVSGAARSQPHSAAAQATDRTKGLDLKAWLLAAVRADDRTLTGEGVTHLAKDLQLDAEQCRCGALGAGVGGRAVVALFNYPGAGAKTEKLKEFFTSRSRSK